MSYFMIKCNLYQEPDDQLANVRMSTASPLRYRINSQLSSINYFNSLFVKQITTILC